MNTPPAVTVLELDGYDGWGLRIDERATPERIGLLQARLLKICENLPRTAAPYGLDHGENGYEACRRASLGLPSPEELQKTNAPGGWHAVATHDGRYDTLGETLGGILTRWLPHSGFKRAEGPLIYRYITDPRETTEADARTEICVPVRPDPIE